MDHMDVRLKGKRRMKRDRDVEVRSALTRTLAGMYCLICCIIGIVVPISEALTYEEGSPFVLTNAFLLYLYIISILIFIYFFTAVFRGGLRLKKTHPKPTSGHGCNKTNSISPNNSTEVQEIPMGENSVEIVHEKVNIAYHGEGMNLYIRIGALVFALGSIVYKLFRLVEPFENVQTRHCIHAFTIFTDVTFMVFVTLQIFFIFKHHAVVINLHKAAVRVCFMHLLSTNLALWVSACTREIVEEMSENSDPNAEIYKAENLTAKVGCREPNTTADRFAPYLFPCIIEYSLIGAAAVYRMYLNVAKPHETVNDVYANGNEVHTPPIAHSTIIDCSNAVAGLVAGIIIIVIAIVGVFVFYYVEAQGKKDVAIYIFLFSDVILVLITMCAAVSAILYMRRLAFAPKEEDSFDDILLVISLGGFYFYSCFMILSSVRNGDGAYFTAGFLTRETLSLIQISIQTVMILDGFRRRADTDDHVQQKPGRAVITFLLTCNFALWIINTFEIKHAEISDLHVNYYGNIAWRLVIHVSLPLVIFYRFHSTVCLSDIWHKAYEKEKYD